MTTDFSCFATHEGHNRHKLYLHVDGMHCAACVWRIESTLNALPQVTARVNLSTQRLVVDWLGDKKAANDFAAKVEQLGFDVGPFDANVLAAESHEDENFLLRCLAVSGFASGNIMLFSLALWFSSPAELSGATRDMMHWVMALIALPTIVYTGMPFYRSALKALRSFHTNMDVPISLAIILAAVMSLHETIISGPHVYFDSSVMLIFFLLIGRYLDKKARGRARDAAHGLLAMMSGTATVQLEGGIKTLPARELVAGMILIIAAGEKIAADCEVLGGQSDIDTSLVTGETLPQPTAVGQRLYAGMINLTAPITARVLAANDKSLLAEIVALMEKAEQAQGKYVRLADRVAGWYTPVVHILAALTFGGWLFFDVPWQEALLHATAVLIITCPCALGLAIPIVHVVASGRLFKNGVLLKSGNALEKLTTVQTVVFDKTGTLTLGVPVLTNKESIRNEVMQLAASMAARSRHPLSQAVYKAWGGPLVELATTEVAGHGLEAEYNGTRLRLGRRSWCGDTQAADDNALELWFKSGTAAPIRFTFSDKVREDAVDIVKKLHSYGLKTMLLSGDRPSAVKEVAEQLGITEWHAAITPLQKTTFVEAEEKQGRPVLMIGDGLNDAAALAAATVSMSPATGIDITQNAADLVFQGRQLSPVLQAWQMAQASGRLVRQNLALSVLYNFIAVPIAVLGYATPLVAAIAMSSSSLIVVLNALRLKRF